MWYPLLGLPLPPEEGASSEGLTCRQCQLSSPRHILPVMEAHMPRNQRPFPDSWPHPHDGMGGADGHARDIVAEPGEHFLPHNPCALRLVGLDDEPFDELIE